MNTKALKFLTHALEFMMIVELAVMNINISAFSIETISLAEMDRLKCQSVKWVKKNKTGMEVLVITFNFMKHPKYWKT